MASVKRFAAMTLCGAAILAASLELGVAETRATQTMKPLAAVSFDTGPKHVVGYFVNVEGACKLTLAINEGGESAATSTTSRLQVSVDAGKSATFDTADGKALLFTCRPSAQTMTAVAIDRIASRADAQ